MKPEELLEGTSPGPWALEGDLVLDAHRSNLIFLIGDLSDAPEAMRDVELALAAPELARRLVEAEKILRRFADEDYRGPEPESRSASRAYFLTLEHGYDLEDLDAEALRRSFGDDS